MLSSTIHRITSRIVIGTTAKYCCKISYSFQQLHRLSQFSSSFSSSSKDDNDDDTTWIPPSRNDAKTQQLNEQSGDEDNMDSFDFVPGLQINNEGHIDEFIDVEDLLKNEELLQQLIASNHDVNGDEFVAIDVSHMSDDDLLLEDEKVDLIEDDEGGLNDDLPDWGWARRHQSAGGKMVSNVSNRNQGGAIPVVDDTLLTTNEVVDCLSSMGGEDISVIEIGHMTSMADTFIISTCKNPSTMRSMADMLCKNMRKRGLQKMGVVGAEKGCEGRNCNDWIVVDCQNIVVHLQDELTRKHVALEKIWGGSETKAMTTLNVDSDEELDNYINANPVPDEYAGKLSLETAFLNLKNKNFNLRQSKTTRSQRMKKGRRKT